MGKKHRAEEPAEDEPIPVLDPDADGVVLDFPRTMEHLRGAKAIIVVVLDRATGDVEVDDTLSTPAETWYALDCAAQVKADTLARTNVDPDD